MAQGPLGNRRIRDRWGGSPFDRLRDRRGMAQGPLGNRRIRDRWGRLRRAVLQTLLGAVF